MNNTVPPTSPDERERSEKRHRRIRTVLTALGVAVTTALRVFFEIDHSG